VEGVRGHNGERNRPDCPRPARWPYGLRFANRHGEREPEGPTNSERAPRPCERQLPSSSGRRLTSGLLTNRGPTRAVAAEVGLVVSKVRDEHGGPPHPLIFAGPSSVGHFIGGQILTLRTTKPHLHCVCERLGALERPLRALRCISTAPAQQPRVLCRPSSAPHRHSASAPQSHQSLAAKPKPGERQKNRRGDSNPGPLHYEGFQSPPRTAGSRAVFARKC
jgi:hypothetical protein